MTPVLLGQYFRSFLIRLTMMEAQLGVMPHSGKVIMCLLETLLSNCWSEETSFAIVIELKDYKSPSAPGGQASGYYHTGGIFSCVCQDPPPWVSAMIGDTTSGASERAELHIIRAVETGIINASGLLKFTIPNLSSGMVMRSCR